MALNQYLLMQPTYHLYSLPPLPSPLFPAKIPLRLRRAVSVPTPQAPPTPVPLYKRPPSPILIHSSFRSTQPTQPNPTPTPNGPHQANRPQVDRRKGAP